MCKLLKSKQLNTFSLRCQFLASERHNLHDDLFLKDPPVISFDKESLLNAVLYVSNEFNDKVNREILPHFIPNLAFICAALHGKLISLRCVLGDYLSYVLFLVIT